MIRSLVVLLAVGLLVAPAAESASPGANGSIAFTSDRDGDGELYVVGADGSGHDLARRLGDDDRFDGRLGNEVAFAGAGDDTLRGARGDDVLAGPGIDELAGGSGNDLLYARDSARGDLLRGGPGDRTPGCEPLT